MKKSTQWAVYILLPIIILLAAAFLRWESISYFVLKKVAEYYAGRANIVLDIEGIKGSPLSKTTITGLSVRPAAGEPQIYQFKAESISCTYNVWDLKKGFYPFINGRSCTAVGPEFSYDLRVETQEDMEGEKSIFFVPPVLPEIDIENGRVILTFEDGIAEFRGIGGNLRSVSGGVHELQLEVDSLRVSDEGVIRIETGFAARLRYADAKLSIASFEVGEEQIVAAGFIDLARMEEGYAEFSLDVLFGESILAVSGALDNQFVQADVRTDNFDIGELQKRAGGVGWDISGTIRGEAKLAYDIESEKESAGSFEFDVHECRVRDVDITTLAVKGDLEKGTLRIAKVRAATSGNGLNLRNTVLPMELLQGLEVFPIIGGVQAEFDAEINDWPEVQKLFALEDELFFEGLTPQRVSVSARVKDGILYLDDARVDAAGLRLAIDRGEIPVPPSAEALASVPVSLKARVESANLQEAAKLFTDVEINGRVAAGMTITGSIKEPRVSIKLSGEAISFKEVLLGSLSLKGDIKVVQEKPGKLKDIQFTVKELTQANNTGNLALLSPAEGAWQPGNFTGSVALQVDGEGEVIIKIVQPRGQDLAVEISTRGLDSDGWLASFWDGPYYFHDADIKAALAGLPDNPQVQLGGSMGAVGWQSMPFPMSGRFKMQYSPKGVEIAEFSWKSHERNEISLKGFLPFDPLAPEPFLDGELILNSHIDFAAIEDIGVFLENLGIRKGGIVLDVDIGGTWKQPLGHVQLQAEGIEAPDQLREYFDEPIDVTCELSAEPGLIVLHTVRLESGVYISQAAGSWQHGYTFEDLLQKNWSDLQGEVMLDASLQLKDLNFLREKLLWLRRIEGDTKVKLHVVGPISAPGIQGSFFLKNGELSHTYNLPMLSSVNLEGEFDADSITITSMQGEAGGSPVTLSGRIRKVSEGIDLNLQLGGSNVLLLRNNYMLLRGDVQLEVTGLLESLLIRGNTALTGGYYTKNIDFLGKIGTTPAPVSEGGTFLFSFEEPPLKNTVLDLRITSIEPFRIRNNLVRGTLRPELTLKGTGELPFLVGVIYIDPSRVLLPSGRLQVQSGLVRFLERDPDRPEIDLVATSKVLDYDINVVMQGPLDEPIYTLSSSPALPNDDLLLLLLTGQPPKEEQVAEPGTLGRGTTNVMVYLGRDFLTKWLEQDDMTSEESILDRFELDYGRAVTKSGEQTIESTFRLSEKEVGEKRVYYLSGEKDRYDAYNYGLKVVFRFE